MKSNLISSQWLADRLGDPGLVIVDASWHLPTTKRDAKAEYIAKHIPNARFYDLDAGADTTTTLPHMMPSAEKFASDMAALGIGNASKVVVYDSVGFFSAARLWWMLKSFGHDKVTVLDGGLRKWEAEGRPITAETKAASSAAFNIAKSATGVRELVDVAAALASNTAQIVDARSPTRFRGEEPEPRPGVRPGHMPGGLNVHYASLLNADGTLKNRDDLKKVFTSAGVDLSRPIITTCGSGVTAAVLILALEELGHSEHSLYDGSWAEWGASDQPVETG